MWISAEDITIQVGERECFAHTRWQIEKNQPWAVIGGNASGKTTLIKAICGQLPLSQGQLRYYFDGEHAGRSTLRPGEIAVLSAESQRAFLRPYAAYHQARWHSFEGEDVPTVGMLLDNVSSTLGLPQRAEIIRLLGLETLLERKVLHLSNGEGRKLLIARLWLSQPHVLVLDDPYTGLDVETRRRLAAALDALLAQGSPTLLLVTARAAEIPAAIRHLVWVEGRRVRAMGERDSVLAARACSRSEAPAASAAPGAAFEGMLSQYAGAAAVRAQALTGDIIDLREVSVRYGGVDVLKNLTWRVRRGERWALLGHNGAGKTTLLSLILGDNPQSYANAITLFGRPRGSGESIWEIKQNIGWVSPELQLHYPPTATCAQVVSSGFFDSVGLHRRPSPQQQRQAADWLGAFGLEKQGEGAFQALSAGEQRLVLLARALVKNPLVLILDEPCQGLDETQCRRFNDLLDALCARVALTVIYVSHYSDELPRCLTHRLLLQDGSGAITSSDPTV